MDKRADAFSRPLRERPWGAGVFSVSLTKGAISVKAPCHARREYRRESPARRRTSARAAKSDFEPSRLLSERILRRHLQYPGIRRTLDDSKRGRLQTVHRIAEVRVVQNVEELEAQFDLVPLRDLN